MDAASPVSTEDGVDDGDGWSGCETRSTDNNESHEGESIVRARCKSECTCRSTLSRRAAGPSDTHDEFTRLCWPRWVSHFDLGWL